VETVRLVLRYAHLIGFALLLGGAIAQYLSAKVRINPAMLWGAVIQVLTGIGLAAPLRGGGDAEPDPAKLVVKGVLAVLIFVMVFFSRKREAVHKGHFLAIVGLTLVNAAVATFWR
jgi:predicted membrane protein